LILIKIEITIEKGCFVFEAVFFLQIKLLLAFNGRYCCFNDYKFEYYF